MCAKTLSLVFVISLLLPAAALARDQHKAKLQLSEPVQIGSTELKPGEYQVVWNGDGPNLQVNFIRNARTIASAPAKLIALRQAAPSDAVVLTPSDNRGARTIDEIDFAKHTQALKIEASR